VQTALEENNCVRAIQHRLNDFQPAPIHGFACVGEVQTPVTTATGSIILAGGLGIIQTTAKNNASTFMG